MIGDLPEDAVMTSRSDYHTVLKIGFINDIEGYENKVEEHSQCYDIIIKGKGSMKHVLYILSKIAKIEFEYDDNDTLKGAMDGL